MVRRRNPLIVVLDLAGATILLLPMAALALLIAGARAIARALDPDAE